MKDSWDRILLMITALIVAGVSVFFTVKTLGFADSISGGGSSGKQGSTFPETDKELSDIASGLVSKPRTWELPLRGNPAKEVPLFVSIPVIELNGEAGDPRDPTFAQMRPPVPNVWLIDNELDYTKRSVLSFDPDQDGFTNLEEWRDKTDPKDKKSHPPLIKKLEFVERVGKAYSIIFQGEPSKGEYQIKREANENYRRATDFVELNGTSKDGQIRVESFEEKFEKADGPSQIEYDRSVLTVTYLPSGEKHELVRKVRKDIFTYYAILDFTLSDAANLEVKKGDTFRLPRDTTVYRLIDVSETVATIQFKGVAGLDETIQIPKREN